MDYTFRYMCMMKNICNSLTFDPRALTESQLYNSVRAFVTRWAGPCQEKGAKILERMAQEIREQQKAGPESQEIKEARALLENAGYEVNAPESTKGKGK